MIAVILIWSVSLYNPFAAFVAKFMSIYKEFLVASFG